MPGNTFEGVSRRNVASVASMRPQRNAGEYNAASGSGRMDARGFNEAPAKCRGIPIDNGKAVGEFE